MSAGEPGLDDILDGLVDDASGMGVALDDPRFRAWLGTTAADDDGDMSSLLARNRHGCDEKDDVGVEVFTVPRSAGALFAKMCHVALSACETVAY